MFSLRSVLYLGTGSDFPFTLGRDFFSGLFYGLFIPFLMLYMNLPSGTFLTLMVDWHTIRFDLNIAPTFSLLLLSAGPICATANIMLANNTCDLEKDIMVGGTRFLTFLAKML